jgi:quercetin dioxygenase-like cupin family protein
MIVHPNFSLVQPLLVILAVILCSSSSQAAGPTVPKPTATLTSSVFDWDKMPVRATATGERREIVDAPTPTLAQFRSHVSTINPGTPWGAPEKHTDEEIVIVKEGTLDYEINGQVHRVNAGGVIIVVAGEFHRVRNSSSAPATYYVFHAVTAEARAAAETLGQSTGSK